MGQARQKLLRESALVKVDLCKPALRIEPADRAVLEKNADGSASSKKVVPRAVRMVIGATIAAAFPQGMDRRDGQVWAAWQECLSDDGEPAFEVPQRQLDWLRKFVCSEDLRTPVNLALWREAVAEYLSGLTNGAKGA